MSLKKPVASAVCAAFLMTGPGRLTTQALAGAIAAPQTGAARAGAPGNVLAVPVLNQSGVSIMPLAPANLVLGASLLQTPALRLDVAAAPAAAAPSLPIANASIAPVRTVSAAGALVETFKTNESFRAIESRDSKVNDSERAAALDAVFDMRGRKDVASDDTIIGSALAVGKAGAPAQGAAYSAFIPEKASALRDGGTIIISGQLNKSFSATIRYDGGFNSPTRGKVFVAVKHFMRPAEPERLMTAPELDHLRSALTRHLAGRQGDQKNNYYAEFLKRTAPTPARRLVGSVPAVGVVGLRAVGKDAEPLLSFPELEYVMDALPSVEGLAKTLAKQRGRDVNDISAKEYVTLMKEASETFAKRSDAPSQAAHEIAVFAVAQAIRILEAGAENADTMRDHKQNKAVLAWIIKMFIAATGRSSMQERKDKASKVADAAVKEISSPAAPAAGGGRSPASKPRALLGVWEGSQDGKVTHKLNINKDLSWSMDYMQDSIALSGDSVEISEQGGYKLLTLTKSGKAVVALVIRGDKLQLPDGPVFSKGSGH